MPESPGDFDYEVPATPDVNMLDTLFEYPTPDDLPPTQGEKEETLEETLVAPPKSSIQDTLRALADGGIGSEDEDAQPRSFGVAPSPRELEQVDTDEAWTPEAAEELPVAPVSPKSPEPGVDMNKVADIRDQSAPKFKPGEHHLSPNAIRCRAKRIFTPRANGSLKVSQAIYDEWHGGGPGQKTLQSIFRQLGYNAEP